jgi:hypothetical protein
MQLVQQLQLFVQQMPSSAIRRAMQLQHPALPLMHPMIMAWCVLIQDLSALRVCPACTCSMPHICACPIQCPDHTVPRNTPAGVPDVQLPAYELLYTEVLQYSMSRQTDDDMRFDSGHKNPNIAFDSDIMTTSLLWTPDKPDSPWIQPTAPSWSRKIAALSGAVQQYLKAAYSKGQKIAPDKVADSILSYMDKQLAMNEDPVAVNVNNK